MRDKCVEMRDNANKMRERLIELIMKTPRLPIIINGRKQGKTYQTVSNIVDHLLANGVVALPCKVGDVVYFVVEDEVIEEGKYISKQQINDVSTKGIFVSDSLTEENCGIFIPFSDLGKTAFISEEEAERALKGAKE